MPDDMPPCCYPGCGTEGRICSFRFPKIDSQRTRKWIEVIRDAKGDDNWNPHSNNRLCNRHFGEKSIVHLGNRNVLMFDAVPLGSLEAADKINHVVGNHLDSYEPPRQPITTNFNIELGTYNHDALLLCAAFLMHVALARKPSFMFIVNLSMDEAADTIEIVESNQSLRSEVVAEAHLQDTPKVSRVPASRKRRFEAMFSQQGQVITPIRSPMKEHNYFQKYASRSYGKRLKVDIGEKISGIRRSQQKQRRCRKRILTLSKLLEMYKSSGGTPQSHDFLKNNFSPMLQGLLENQKPRSVREKYGVRYPEDVKQFAVTLHFYSPKAYGFLRRYLMLPHESTLFAWMSSLDCHPRFGQKISESICIY